MFSESCTFAVSFRRRDTYLSAKWMKKNAREESRRSMQRNRENWLLDTICSWMSCTQFTSSTALCLGISLTTHPLQSWKSA
ncbi:hypothetical protein U0070_001178 [Myodes glareolus]|uniref:Uncharacterized protein n=1 Tax=Myodes glareolus TaxID=447135 RepID=A0AAW0HJ01_MYOGA